MQSSTVFRAKDLKTTAGQPVKYLISSVDSTLMRLFNGMVISFTVSIGPASLADKVEKAHDGSSSKVSKEEPARAFPENCPGNLSGVDVLGIQVQAEAITSSWLRGDRSATSRDRDMQELFKKYPGLTQEQFYSVVAPEVQSRIRTAQLDLARSKLKGYPLTIDEKKMATSLGTGIDALMEKMKIVDPDTGKPSHVFTLLEKHGAQWTPQGYRWADFQFGLLAQKSPEGKLVEEALRTHFFPDGSLDKVLDSNRAYPIFLGPEVLLPTSNLSMVHSANGTLPTMSTTSWVRAVEAHTQHFLKSSNESAELTRELTSLGGQLRNTLHGRLKDRKAGEPTAKDLSREAAQSDVDFRIKQLRSLGAREAAYLFTKWELKQRSVGKKTSIAEPLGRVKFGDSFSSLPRIERTGAVAAAGYPGEFRWCDLITIDNDANLSTVFRAPSLKD